jgi:hypothetical protein
LDAERAETASAYASKLSAAIQGQSPDLVVVLSNLAAVRKSLKPYREALAAPGNHRDGRLSRTTTSTRLVSDAALERE